MTPEYEVIQWAISRQGADGVWYGVMDCLTEGEAHQGVEALLAKEPERRFRISKNTHRYEVVWESHPEKPR